MLNVKCRSGRYFLFFYTPTAAVIVALTQRTYFGIFMRKILGKITILRIVELEKLEQLEILQWRILTGFLKRILKFRLFVF